MIDVFPDGEFDEHIQGINCVCKPKIIVTDEEIIILHREIKMSELYWVATN